MKIKTIYIDDDKRDLKKYKRKFEDDARSKNKFDIATINVQKKLKNLLDEVEEQKPELILVDFKLDKPKDDILIGISGITLSTALRERFLDIPIVLFTRKDVFSIEKYPFKKGFATNLDGFIYKRDLFKKEENLDSLYELAIGFKKLRETRPKKWNNLFKLLGAPEDEYEHLRLSNPSMVTKEGNNEWSVSDAANWIRNILIKYPGILYDPMWSATFLGISIKEFSSDVVQKFFAEARYTSILSPPEGRWWRSKLHKIALSIMNEKDMNLSLQNGFPQAWERENKEEIERSKCIFSGESPADWVCYILNKPVKIKYSLSYRPDSRPEVMDEARVSFTAIINSNEVDDELFYPLGRDMLPKIRDIQEEG
ncbi:MAG: hypothetical protein PVF58_19605 [Candidatus Methanofastidiosia archaeon]|jgi:hypothetical protein